MVKRASVCTVHLCLWCVCMCNHSINIPLLAVVGCAVCSGRVVNIWRWQHHLAALHHSSPHLWLYFCAPCLMCHGPGLILFLFFDWRAGKDNLCHDRNNIFGCIITRWLKNLQLKCKDKENMNKGVYVILGRFIWVCLYQIKKYCRTIVLSCQTALSRWAAHTVSVQRL